MYTLMVSKLMHKKQSSIGRRLEHSLESLIENDYESSLVHFFPALDKTAKLRRPNAGVGERIKGFLNDEEPFITFLSFGMVFKNTKFDGLTFGEAIYKFGRTSVMHEGELDPRLTFHTEDKIQASRDLWVLPTSYIAAMITAVMAAEENSQEFFSKSMLLQLNDKKINTNEIWGNKIFIQTLINMPNV